MRREIFSPPLDRTQPGREGGFNLSRWAIDHGGFTAFLLVLLLAAGVLSFIRIGQKEDPDFTFRVMVVQVQWPGATVEEMQEQVVDKMERKLQEVPGVDFIRSYTRSGFANIFVNLKGSIRGDAVREAFYQARKKVGDIRATLPDGVIGPFFNDEFGDTYISLYAVTGRGFSHPELKNIAKGARDILLRVPGVAKVNLLGTQEERIFIEVSSAVLAERGLSVLDIQAALAGQNAMDPAGRIETGERSVRIDVEGGLRSVEDVRELRLNAGQQTFRLGDIADVRRGLEDPPAAKTRYQGREAVLLGTTMAPGANVTEVGAEVERTLRRIERGLPIGVELSRVSDQAQVVTQSIHQFLEAFGEAVAIVLIVSLIALGWRAGIVVALTIPLVLAATFFVMSLMGIDLHRISLGALIIALGLLVDDAMIAVEMMDRKLREGHDRLAAATFAYTSTAFPMLTGTLITVAGFIPVGFAQSTAGEYVSTLFWVTGIALIISWFAAVYFTPWIGYRVLKPPGRAVGEHDAFDSRPYRIIRAIVSACVRRRGLVVVLTVGALGVSVASFSLIPKQFFPTSNRSEILVDLWLPEGSGFEEVEREAKRLEQQLSTNPDLAYAVSFIGEGAPRFYLPLDQQLRNQNFAQLLLMSKSIEARERLLNEVREILARDFPNVRYKADRLFNGPPVGWPVQLRVTGPDRTEVRRLASEVADVMRADPNVSSVHDDWLEPVPALKLEIDQDRARALGVSSQSARRALQTMLSGFQIGEFREKDETIKMMVREPSDTRSLLSALDHVYVKTATGASVPLRQVANVRVTLEPGIQWRRDRLPSITVRGAVPDGVQSADVTQAIFARLKPLRDGLAADYRIEMQGAVEEFGYQPDVDQRKDAGDAFRHRAAVDGAAAAFRQDAYGAGHRPARADRRRHCTARLPGAVRLRCDPRRDRARRHHHAQQCDPGRSDPAGFAAGHDTFTAIVESAVRRFRPITLTAAAAVLALIPLAGEVFWAPMALAMMGGVIAATVLTLTFLPALYALAFRVRLSASHGQHGDDSFSAPLPALQAAE